MAAVRIAVLISGRGSNMAALLDYARQEESPVEAVLVLADRDALGLDIARQAYDLGEDRAVGLARGDYAAKEDFEAAVIGALEGAGAELVCLAGFMRLLSAGFCERYDGRLVNIHPSLLPELKGLDTHGRALAEKRRVHGCSVHFVTPGMDEGPVIAQSEVLVQDGDSEEMLADRVLVEEHKLLPLVVGAIAAGLVVLEDGAVVNRAGEVPGRIGGMDHPLRWKRERSDGIVTPAGAVWRG